MTRCEDRCFLPSQINASIVLSTQAAIDLKAQENPQEKTLFKTQDKTHLSCLLAYFRGVDSEEDFPVNAKSCESEK